MGRGLIASCPIFVYGGDSVIAHVAAVDHDKVGGKQNNIDIIAVRNNLTGDVGLMVDMDMLKSTFTQEYTTSQTALAILTPTAGYKLCIRNVEIVTDATTGIISLDFLTSSKKVSRLYAAAANKNISNTAHLVGSTNEVLTLTTTIGAKNVFLLVTYVEHL